MELRNEDQPTSLLNGQAFFKRSSCWLRSAAESGISFTRTDDWSCKGADMRFPPALVISHKEALLAAA